MPELFPSRAHEQATLLVPIQMGLHQPPGNHNNHQQAYDRAIHPPE